MMVGFGSEYVAYFESEWVAGFVGIRKKTKAEKATPASESRTTGYQGRAGNGSTDPTH